jgi:hypothetical protein
MIFLLPNGRIICTGLRSKYIYYRSLHLFQGSSRLAHAVTFMTCIQEIAGSILSRNTGYPDKMYDLNFSQPWLHFCLLGYKVVVGWKSADVSERNDTSGFRANRALLATCLILVSCLLFNLEDGGDMFLWNVGWCSTDYTVWYLRRRSSSYPDWKFSWLSSVPPVKYRNRQWQRYLYTLQYFCYCVSKISLRLRHISTRQP